MHVHIALVSDQTLANLIPALVERPDRVVLVCSGEMRERGLHRRFRRVFGRYGLAFESEHDAPSVRLTDIRAYALDLLIRLQQAYPGAVLTLNATGGTKLMAMGFVETLREEVERVIYADTAHGQIEVLHDRHDSAPPPRRMPDVLDVPGYLAAQGFVSDERPEDEGSVMRRMARKAAAKHLGRHVEELGGFIAAMNRVAMHALDEREEQFRNPHFELETFSRPWREACDQLAKAGLIDRVDGRQFVFMNVEAARFLKGRWLEEYAWHVVRDERPHDCRLNVKGHWEAGDRANNEFDVLACDGNELLFVECKTLAYTEGRQDSELSYQLESLGRDCRGLFGQTWLLSAQQPSQVLLQRAVQARITLLGPQELPRLRDHVKRWRERR